MIDLCQIKNYDIDNFNAKSSSTCVSLCIDVWLVMASMKHLYIDSWAYNVPCFVSSHELACLSGHICAYNLHAMQLMIENLWHSNVTHNFRS